MGGISLSTIPFAHANQTPIDLEREKIIIFSRQGDGELKQAIPQLEKLFQRTKDVKVRDDLIALYLRNNQSAQALKVCDDCTPAKLSESELENLGRAARNEKQFQRSFELYAQLEKKYPQNPNGLLGKALVATELKNYTVAKDALAQYKKRFGEDNGYVDARSYLLDFTEPDVSKLGRWQRELAKNPKNTHLAGNLYRLAAKYNIHPLQEKLQREYPDLFSEKDFLWFEHDKAVSSAKNAQNDRKHLKNSFAGLTALLNKIDSSNPLYQQTLMDRFVLGTRLSEFDAIRDDYDILKAQPNPPAYLQEALGDYELAQASPHKALAIYQSLAQQAVEKKQAVNEALLFKLFSAASDAGEFKLAQQYLEQMKDVPYVNDYTHTSRIPNPHYDERYFGLARLALWRGNAGQAQKMIDDRALDKTPGDAWVLLQKAELERNRYNFDDAKEWAHQAEAFFIEADKKYVRHSLIETALRQNDLPTAKRLVQEMSAEELDSVKPMMERYDLAHKGRIVGSVNLQHRTSAPTKQPNESTQNYAIYTPKTAEGHDLYVRYMETRTPVSGNSLNAQFVGVGAELNFYPLNMRLETGKGIKLNKRGYATSDLSYELNQRWTFNLRGHINGSEVPVRAVAQNVYTKGGGASVVYTYSDIFQLGGGVYFSRFSDGNLRRDANLWLNTKTFKHDRWALTNNFRVDYTRNKTIESADYYNPTKAIGYEIGGDLTYYQPFDYGFILTHHLKGSFGAYKQQEQERNKTWSVSYGHEWRIGKKYGFFYEVGRKKNVYDGNPEFNNFGNLSFSLYY
ncbi:poly-beta-1,6 N-acetyl-D-glucosamine export porin PgaA [Aggregatibacter kilianii]|uniref:poly-beta-1,6 N-acetyl-D-glucosamine export porin PgaA n=1 Tax=Aggregatibacter kilianii TaxID=2025884 RepID=UPI003D1B81F8